MGTGKGDIGYSYLSFVQEGKKQPVVITQKQHRSAVRLALKGDIVTTPKTGSVKLTTHWNIDFWLEPAVDYKHGCAVPAWLVQPATEKRTQVPDPDDKSGEMIEQFETDANTTLVQDSIQFEFKWQAGHMMSVHTGHVSLAVFHIVVAPNTLKTGDALRRPCFPPGFEAAQGSATPSLSDRFKKNMVRPHAKNVSASLVHLCCVTRVGLTR